MLLMMPSRIDQGADRRVDPEHQLHRAERDLGEQRQPHAEKRRHEGVGDVEALAVEPGAVADREQHQRGGAQGLDQQAVDQQADREAGDGAEQAAAEQPERDDDRGQDVGAGVEDLTWEKKESCSSTATTTIATMRARMLRG